MTLEEYKQNTIKQFEMLGIDILEENGDFKPFPQIVEDVSKVYPKMSNEDNRQPKIIK